MVSHHEIKHRQAKHFKGNANMAVIVKPVVHHDTKAEKGRTRQVVIQTDLSE